MKKKGPLNEIKALKNTQKIQSVKHPGRDVLNGVQRVPVPCLVTPAEGKGISCPASWVTLQDLVCNGENIRRKCMDHTGWSNKDH